MAKKPTAQRAQTQSDFANHDAEMENIERISAARAAENKSAGIGHNSNPAPESVQRSYNAIMAATLEIEAAGRIMQKARSELSAAEKTAKKDLGSKSWVDSVKKAVAKVREADDHERAALNAEVEHAMTCRAEHPEHVALIEAQRAPAAVAAELWPVGGFKHASFIASHGLADERQVGISPTQPVYQRVRSAAHRPGAIVGRHGAGIEILEAQMIATPCSHRALCGAVLLVRSRCLRSHERHRTDPTGNRGAKPLAFGGTLSSGGCRIRSTSCRAVSRWFVPSREGLRAMPAVAIKRALENAGVGHV